MTNDPLLTPGQAAKRIGVSSETVKRWMRKGAIPYRQIGRRRKVLQSVIDAQVRDVPHETTNDTNDTHHTNGRNPLP